jgi:hypothetical protein
MASKQVYVNIKDAVKLASDEVILETYEGFEIVDPVGKGFFTITNYRFIYYASSKDKDSDSVSVTEWPINQIGGIISEMGKRVNIVQKIIAIVLFVLGMSFLGYSMYLFFNTKVINYIFISGGCAAIITALFLYIFRKRKMFSLEVYTKTNRSSLLSLRSSFFKSPNHGKIKIKPNSTTALMIKELGKAVIEAQQFRKPRAPMY